MWRHFIPALALVQTDHVLVIDGKTAIGVNGHAEQARVRLQQTSHQPSYYTYLLSVVKDKRKELLFSAVNYTVVHDHKAVLASNKPEPVCVRHRVLCS